MTESMTNILNPNSEPTDQQFPHAPNGWSASIARQWAGETGLELVEDHWSTIRALQEFFARNSESKITARKIHDALNEKFHSKGGIKYVYELFPEGPINQGCRIAGLTPPAGALDKGFGSVQ
ncbi:MAG: TusE/DsrC/DsvC family sulfur relay protein [Gammaproteobacteria bacterium]|nr:TusE/DsrC/DsvC family sulfur relay protein [Gammaproteobacteria bacterium]MDH3466827.1 TusE/DsrC/DsvC family sulfur relay protein [Gammaproteobacteria bacterium]